MIKDDLECQNIPRTILEKQKPPYSGEETNNIHVIFFFLNLQNIMFLDINYWMHYILGVQKNVLKQTCLFLAKPTIAPGLVVLWLCGLCMSNNDNIWSD